jgi:hypothetical protein
MIRSDVCGFIYVEIPDGAKFFVLFSDDFEPTEEREIDVTLTLSDEQLPDSFTKPLPNPRFSNLRDAVNIASYFSSNFFFDSSLAFSIVVFEGECWKWYKHLLT